MRFLPAKGYRPIWIDFPPVPRPRWGHGRPAHEPLRALFESGREGYRSLLRDTLRERDRLAAIPVRGRPESGDPYWDNGYLPGLDAAVLYGLVAHRAPPRYVEIGSGHSTRFVARAIRDHALPTEIVAYDPSPRASVASLAGRVHPLRLEDLPDGDLIRSLGPGDVLFFDGSHRALENSDVTVFFLEILPRLPAGVCVQIHDICLPFDYPPGWEGRWYSEQYLLAAYLLGGGAGMRIVFPGAFASADPELSALMAPLWEEPSLRGVVRGGSSFWFETVPRDEGR
jgi:hypothetical protein